MLVAIPNEICSLGGTSGFLDLLLDMVRIWGQAETG